MPFLTWGSSADLAVGLLDEAPLVPVVVRYDPTICGPMWPTGPLLRGAKANSDDVVRHCHN